MKKFMFSLLFLSSFNAFSGQSVGQFKKVTVYSVENASISKMLKESDNSRAVARITVGLMVESNINQCNLNKLSTQLDYQWQLPNRPTFLNLITSSCTVKPLSLSRSGSSSASVPAKVAVTYDVDLYDGNSERLTIKTGEDADTSTDVMASFNNGEIKLEIVPSL
ncbi:MAG: hypothetical protein ACOYL6_19375 [Bacteriovoracaceae bacterium]